MSSNLSNSVTSNFYQQSPPSMNIIEGRKPAVVLEIVYQWHVNEFVVYLIKEHDSLKYKTTDRDRKEIYTNYIEIPESENLRKNTFSSQKMQGHGRRKWHCKFFYNLSHLEKFQ